MSISRMALTTLALAMLTATAWSRGAGQTGGSQGATAAGNTSRYREAPILTQMVSRGEIPPVDQRLPEQPFVQNEILGEIGEYGGTIYTFTTDNLMWGDLQEEPERGNFILRMNQDGSIEPEVALDVQMLDGNTRMRVVLRRGMKWSDGEPLDADDVLFMYDGMHWNEDIETWGLSPFIEDVVKVDDVTVDFIFDAPHPEYYIEMTTFIGSDLVMYHPEHYLSKWHIDYNPDAESVARAEGHESWLEAFRYHAWWVPLQDLEKPTTQPWMPTSSTTTVKTWTRNPYYFVVDPEMQQLPYIDNIHSTIVDLQTYHLKIISGESDLAFAATDASNYTLYRQNEQAGGYRVEAIPGINGSEVAYYPNINHPDPVMRQLYGDIRFRRALSLAIDRDEINELVFLGLGVPRQATVNSTARYYKPEWGEEHPYARYDVAQARALLDQMGLTRRDGSGFRLRPGENAPITIVIEGTSGAFGENAAKVHELVKEYWEAVGLRTEIRLLEATLWRERGLTSDHELRTQTMSNTGEYYAYLSEWIWTPRGKARAWARDWGNWFQAEQQIEAGLRTLADYGGRMPGAEPPAAMKEYWDFFHEWQTTEFGSERYFELAERVFDFLAENTYFIGTVGLAPTLFVAKNYVHNIPTQYAPHFEVNLNLNYYANQFWMSKHQKREDP